MLKTSLLLPPDPALGEASQAWYVKLPSRHKTSWALIPLSLWHFRKGEYFRVIELARTLSNEPPGTTALVPTVQAILAMTLWQLGETDEARAMLRVREAVNRHFAVPVPMGEGDSRRGYWHDWIFARIDRMSRKAWLLEKARRHVPRRAAASLSF